MAPCMKLFYFLILSLGNLSLYVCSQNIENDVPEGINIADEARKLTSKRNSRPLDENEYPNSQQSKNGGYTMLSRGSNITIPAHTSSNHLEVFCYAGDSKLATTIFRSVEVNLDIKSSNFRHYEASNASEVRRLYAETSWFSFSPWRSTTFSLELYETSCVGIESREPYNVYLRIKGVDWWRLALLVCGAMLYCSAPGVSRSLLFHYFSGGVLGVTGSLLIVVFLLSRLLPRRAGAVTFLVGGSGVMLYALQFFYKNFVHVLSEYSTLFIGYLVVTLLLTWAAIYRWGPVTDERSLKLLQWCLQACGLFIIYCSSQLKEASVSIILLLVLYTNSPAVVSKQLSNLWQKMFPPKRKLLTKEEYVLQGQIATVKALEELRDYCKSPKCNAWRTFSRLESPLRFAEFVEGDSHLKDKEVDEFEESLYSGRGFPLPPAFDDLTDDDSD